MIAAEGVLQTGCFPPVAFLSKYCYHVLSLVKFRAAGTIFND